MIKENIKNILKELPKDVRLVVAAKKRSVEEVKEAIESGAKIVGENYVREAKEKYQVIGDKVKWHLIGHLQKNKAKLAVKIFDMIETLDSLELAGILDKECKKINKIIPVLIEVNCASELQKYGVLAEDVHELLEGLLQFKNLKPAGLMTMGPWLSDSEKLRPYFRKTKSLFDKIKDDYGFGLQWDYLSMGMSNSYKIGIEEGANIIRVGTAVFGHR